MLDIDENKIIQKIKILQEKVKVLVNENNTIKQEKETLEWSMALKKNQNDLEQFEHEKTALTKDVRTKTIQEITKGQNLNTIQEEDLLLMIVALKKEKKSRYLCVVCMENTSSQICLPCAHACVCRSEVCVQSIKNTCPVCRTCNST